MLRKTVLGCIGVVVASYAAPQALASLLINGDFENTAGWGAAGSTSFPAGWTTVDTRRKNAAEIHSGGSAIGGSGTSAFMPAFPTGDVNARREIYQELPLAERPGHWVFSMDFASEMPSITSRTLAMTLRHGATQGQGIGMRIVQGTESGRGSIEVLSGGAWTNIMPNAVVFDDDVQVNPLVHQLQLTGDYTSASTRYYSVFLTNSLGQEFAALNVNIWSESIPQTSEGLRAVHLHTFLSDADYLVDNVSISVVPEPASMLVLGLGSVSLLCRRRAS